MLDQYRPISCVALIVCCIGVTACGGSRNTSAKVRARTESASTSSASAAQSAAVNSSADFASGPTIAQVDGRRITLGEARHWMANSGTGKQEVPDPPSYGACIAHLRASDNAHDESPAHLKGACQQRYEKMLRSALNSLIHVQWLTGEAREEGVKIDQAALDREVTQGMKARALVHQTASSTGKSAADLRLELKLGQLSNGIYEAIKRSTPNVTYARIAGYYNVHKQSFGLPQERDLHLIRTANAASAMKVLHEIGSGRSFASVVKEVTTLQPFDTKEGLLLGLTPKLFSEPVLAHAIFRARPHVLSGPVRISLGYYVFEVTRVIPAHQQTLAQVKASIAQRLPELLRTHALRSFVAAFRKRWTARTDCRAGYVVENCRQYKGPRPVRDPYTV
jgi:foldase protein PrsA